MEMEAGEFRRLVECCGDEGASWAVIEPFTHGLAQFI